MKITIPPQAAGTVRALSQIGYSPETAICDLIDNSIQAGATNIEVFQNIEENWMSIRDNGRGMIDQQIIDAFTYGKRTEDSHSLGKFGMGLKTAATSLGNRISIFSATRPEQAKDTDFSGTFTLDVASIELNDKWEIERTEIDTEAKKRFIRRHNQLAPEILPPGGHPCTGTFLKIDKLKNVLGKEYQDRTSKPFYKAIKDFVKGLELYIGRTYYHYLKDGIKISVEGKFVEPVNPLEKAEVFWETSYTLTGVKHEEELPIKVLKTQDETGVFIYRERRLIEAGRSNFGIKKDSCIAVLFEFTENLDNILEVDLQKSKIEHLKLDADIIDTIERKVKEARKEAIAFEPLPTPEEKPVDASQDAPIETPMQPVTDKPVSDTKPVITEQNETPTNPQEPEDRTVIDQPEPAEIKQHNTRATKTKGTATTRRITNNTTGTTNKRNT